MLLSEEMGKLDELHRRGALTDEEFARAKARLLEGLPAGDCSPAVRAVNALRRSRRDRWISGVCGGLARATGAEGWVWRLAFAALTVFGGLGLLLYVLMWIFVPLEAPQDRLPVRRSGAGAVEPAQSRGRPGTCLGLSVFIHRVRHGPRRTADAPLLQKLKVKRRIGAPPRTRGGRIGDDWR